jgi:hypothetical protein
MEYVIAQQQFANLSRVRRPGHSLWDILQFSISDFQCFSSASFPQAQRIPFAKSR